MANFLRKILNQSDNTDNNLYQENGITKMKKEPVCHCGSKQFGIRADAVQMVGLFTCSNGHHSLLLDSRDYWNSIIQDGKPKELKCTCKNKLFEAELIYSFRENSEDISAVDLVTTCTNCNKKDTPFTIRINYGPTGQLITQPLDSIENPWQKTHQMECSALWLKEDYQRFLSWMMDFGPGSAYVLNPQIDMPVIQGKETLLQVIDQAKSSLILFYAKDFTPQNGDSPKNAPMIKVSGPMKMVYNPPNMADAFDMYNIEFATEIIKNGEIVSQPQAFIATTNELMAWLTSSFTSQRGKKTFDNPGEYFRFKEIREAAKN